MKEGTGKEKKGRYVGIGDIGKKSYAPTPKQSGRSIWLGALTHGLC